MAEIVKVCGVARDKIASICGIQNIKRICSIDFLVVVFGTLMSFLIPDDMEITEGHTVEGSTIISGDPDKWIATKSKDHADGKQLVSAIMKYLLTNPVVMEIQVESTASVLKVTCAIAILPGHFVITDQGRSQVVSVVDHGNNLYTLTLATPLTTAPASAYLDPLWVSLLPFNSTTTGFDTQEPVEVGDIIFADTGQGTVLTVSENTGVYSVTLTEALPSIPAMAVKKSNATLKVGVGATGEYMSPEQSLTLTGTPTTTSFDVNGGYATEIYTEGGIFNSLIVDGVEQEVSSVSETVNEGNATPVLPTMSDYTQDGFTVTASADVGAGPAYEAAGDGPDAYGWACPDLIGWWQVHLPEPRLITGYDLWAATSLNWDRDYTATSWVLRGSNDGINWTILDTKTDQPNWSAGEQRQYPVSPDQAYEYYKVDVSTSESGSTNGIGKIQMCYVPYVYTTTIIPATELPAVPESVSIPDRLLDLPCSLTCAITSGGLEISGEKIVFEDNPALRALAMAMKIPAGWTVKDLSILPERMG
ncbi:discoidin domain-containing protein [Maridesulfovibrio sp.]|uniref:discoidin domain-containing protein n=1 Tax=Maridesulfovibrio sp. TaxID=2795000 RepID=UPI0029C9C81D|nr:discoidin domain-containing protein [Maridesulfovibrio sp.]